MGPITRAALVAACRLELKQAYGRPKLRAGASDSERGAHRRSLADWENSRDGMRTGERLRERLEGPRPEYILSRARLGRGEYRERRIPDQPEQPARPMSYRDQLRANRRMMSRTRFSGPNGILRTITPHERINAIGTASRRRHVSPGLVPGSGRAPRVLGRHEP